MWPFKNKKKDINIMIYLDDEIVKMINENKGKYMELDTWPAGDLLGFVDNLDNHVGIDHVFEWKSTGNNL